jgi:hypothetical protein
VTSRYYTVMFLKILPILLLFFSFETAIAQQTVIKGSISEEEGEKLHNTEIIWVEGNTTVRSNEKGDYSIPVKPGKVTLLIRYTSYHEQEITLEIKAGEKLTQNIKLISEIKTLNQYNVDGQKNTDPNRNEVSTFVIDPKIPKYLPSPFGEFTKILATLPGVVSNSELSSQYLVRGGNFDENLVYVNDMEVYRPFLVRAGQQEGLSFVNPDMVSNIEFSAGGWQPKYGDKLSSVLAIKYKEPKKFKGSATLGLLGFAAHLENATKNRRVSYIIGARNKNSKYLLNTLPTKGEYKPHFYDIQSLIVFDFTKRKDSTDFEKRTTLSVLTNYSINRYDILPSKSQTTFGTIAEALRLDVVFSGKETMQYNTIQNGLKFSHKVNDRLRLDFLTSAVHSAEREFFDIETIYRLCEIETSQNSQDFNKCILSKGSGSNFRHARNELQATIITVSHKGQYDWNSKNQLLWGITEGNETIKDKISEYSFSDSSQYVTITDQLNSSINLNSYRTQAYIQHSWKPDSNHVITYGVRVSYWTVNKQFLTSPRIQYAYKPKWKRDFIFKVSTGVYQQPAFYREMRSYSGTINKDIKAQTSYHFIVGSDYNFKIWDRKFKFISELYYKSLTNVIPYDMDNVRLRYYAVNSAVAYATGIDLRVSGEFLKGEQSWFSLSFLNTKEDVKGDGKGYIRRPTDQRITAGIFFQDHIPNNPTLKMYLNFVYGSGLPFGPPKATQYRSYFSGPLYNRVDIGFSKLISFQDKEKLSRKGLESLWISLEVLNLIGTANTISYTWIKDYNNNQFAVPNTLSARFVNIRMIARF